MKARWSTSVIISGFAERQSCVAKEGPVGKRLIVSKQCYLRISNGYWRSEKVFNAVFGLWIIELTCSLKQVEKCIQRAACACLHICFLYCRVLLCHMCVWALHVKDSSHAELWGHRHDSIHGLMTRSSHVPFRLFRFFRLLRVGVKNNHKAFLQLKIHPKLRLFYAVSERTRICCPPWTAGIWFWSRPGGRAGTTAPSATSTTTMSLSGWRTWARMSSDFSKRSESELGGGHATHWPFSTHEVMQLICLNHNWRHANKYMCKNVSTYMRSLWYFCDLCASLQKSAAAWKLFCCEVSKNVQQVNFGDIPETLFFSLICSFVSFST